MNFISKTFLFASIFSSITSAVVFKAGVDDDPSRNRERYGHGSLIKDKGSFLNSMFDKNATKAKDENNEKLKIKKENAPCDNEDPFKKTWYAILKVIEDIPLIKLDIENRKIETQSVNIESFDTTGSCKYKLLFKVSPDGNFSLDITSEEDSKIRIDKLKELTIEKINKAKN